MERPDYFEKPTRRTDDGDPSQKPGTARRACGGIFLMLAFSVLLSFPFARASSTTDPQSPGQVTPVSGPSWLSSLGSSFELSCMGRTGRWGPSPEIVSSHSARLVAASDAFLLTGADIYRFSCRACHRPDGSGCQPEIASLIGAVQATSVAVIQASMERRGLHLPVAMLRTMVSQNEASFLQRLKEGGQRMPAFAHLNSAEIRLLQGYLHELVGAAQPKAKEPTILESSDRVGELIVKGTCHTCHNATDSRHFRVFRVDKEIPALATLPKTRTLEQVLRKVRHGSPDLGGRRGRMPIFSYLTQEEVAAVYQYLASHPPVP